jgi:lipopolysaccharide biosynthesis glycosyltransferase
MDIVFNINLLGMEGLGPTLTSLVRNCSNSKELKIWFFCSNLKDQDKTNISYLLSQVSFEGTIKFIDYDAKVRFGHLRSLHGDWTAYGRLLIGENIFSERALYLDSDLVVLLDVLTLKNIHFNGKVFAAVYGCSLEWALDHSFFTTHLNWSLDNAYFNSGVILFNLEMWREGDYTAKWNALAEKYPQDLISHDQTLLNAICDGKFLHLLKKYNNEWSPSMKKPEDADHSIIHFVGSPKPWDIFGQNIHEGFEIWNSYTIDFWQSKYGKLSLIKILRAWRIKRSLVRSFISRKS